MNVQHSAKVNVQVDASQHVKMVVARDATLQHVNYNVQKVVQMNVEHLQSVEISVKMLVLTAAVQLVKMPVACQQTV